MTTDSPLPPGQQLRSSFERFGLGRFANKFPADARHARFQIGGDVATSLVVDEQLRALPRVSQRSDFHCVTTWSVQGLEWQGFRFADFYARIVEPLARPKPGADFVVLKGQDGYRTCMHLPDLLHDDVLLADTLNGAPLDIAHGAPLRLVAPAHYGYKNMKHLAAIEFRVGRGDYRFPFPYPGLMDHPRARVALEERVRYLPAAWVRPLYRMLIPVVIGKSRRALARHLAQDDAAR